MGKPVVHFEIVGKDGAALRAFYSELFDWKIDDDNPMGYGMIDRESNLSADGVGISGGIMQVPEGYDGHVTVYVEVPDVEAALVHAEKLGATRMMGPESPIPGLVIGLFTDPDGHTVGVLTSTQPD